MPDPGKYFQKPGGHSEGFLENFSRLFSKFLISGHEWGAFLENFSSWISWLPTKEKMILEIGSWLRGVSGKFFQTNFIYTYSGKNALKKSSGKIFQKSFWVITRKSSISISILNHVFWKKFPRILLCHDPKSLKWHLEIFSRKPPDSPPVFFDVINFELKYLKKVIYEVYCDILSRCTSPPPIDATWLIPIIVHGDVTRE